MKLTQPKNLGIHYFIEQLQEGKLGKAMTIEIRLYVPKHFRKKVIIQFHDNAFTGKTFDAIRTKYYWPISFKKLMIIPNLVLYVRIKN